MQTIHLTAFIDWDSAKRSVPISTQRRQLPTKAEEVNILQDGIAEILTASSARSVFRVAIRLYHGWHRGKTKTPERRELELLPLASRTINRVSFASEVTFGNELLCGGRRSYLYDTLRRREDGKDEQKMVDTALTSDLLHYARTNRGGLAVVVGDDDDLLPGVFTAEAWGLGVMVLRISRADDNQHIPAVPLIVRRSL